MCDRLDRPSYLFDSGIASCVSFVQSFSPQAGAEFNDNVSKPTTGEQYEIGIKCQRAEIGALVTLSAFQLAQQNTLTTDPADPLFQLV
ncbi:TonB-dependent receptor [Shinella sp. CPCC 100929]|uniref:TonB-dependent receptor n=1 Tax=Shinella lacus TaxID=2654216 RepID=A0ABT1REA1_9HYPH|nr:TonB-dependent receptor [Shinella lacus]MCQ4633526.1 TonB-dependent receptor [Shinella lacus]